MLMNLSDRDIQIGIIGIGAMGKGLLYQSIITKGIKTVAVCDINLEKACNVLRDFKMEYKVVDDSVTLNKSLPRAKSQFSKMEKCWQMRMGWML